MIKKAGMSHMVFAMLFPALILSGCSGGSSAPKGGGKVIAKINNYELTEEDFRDNAAIMTRGEFYARDKEKAKKEFLEELITKNVLLQEAQAQDFDKDKAFMKEIQRYWEQALLKLLIKKKTREISGSMNIREPEEIRHRKVKEAMSQWVETLRRNARVTVYKENLKNLEI